MLAVLGSRSLRVRFGLGVVVLMAVALALFGTFVYWNVDRGLRSGVDDSLRVSASQAAATVDVDSGKLVLGDALSADNTALDSLRARGHTSGYLDPSGKISRWIRRALELECQRPDPGRGAKRAPAFFNLSDAALGQDYRLYTLPVVAGPKVVGYVQVFQSLGSVEDTSRRSPSCPARWRRAYYNGRRLGGLLPRRSRARPYRCDYEDRAAHLCPDLSARLNIPPTEDEVGRLASTFDDMLERLDSSFKRERQFTADASHELRTPLAAMEAILSVIRSEPREPAEYEQALDDLAEETARLRALAEDLLRLARGAQPVFAELDPVDISVLAQDVGDALKPLAEAKDLYLRCDIEPDLTIMGDSDSLIRVFLNLVDNAIKFTEHGGVTIKTFLDVGAAVVEVTDTGVGIPAERLSSIFERFYRADSSRTTAGTGLGLALALQIVQNHGGTLTAQSSEGVGSTFTVRFGKKSPGK